MRVVVARAIWDQEAQVWSSVVEDLRIFTEAPSIEVLRERLKLVVPDALEINGETADDVSIEIIAHVSDHVKLDAA
ncbi:Domain of unknown function DUF1902 [Ancylobacter novellus DSM 506]|jgi:hypothetical protein|uniref:DUF1902 domain-containing protein n=1 Tax=Ancylobacter novellus (strain ATCC 8093 / DSM 506 / JCM 20403 / CCM 1077 / IAM 12100 / NBRC 12443 / NCIMB 10456) TaxID=639283 RepID=D7A746_ANCN5|nr:DUF1902 domain-containing protein [Ancylobacter novellus]ADH90277.1 Domain of unknown function DUF1902 [Ancylobacter novellus DSM 506]MDF2618123.1 hypothetical protein [Xanthobacteraceae bacterium]